MEQVRKLYVLKNDIDESDGVQFIYNKNGNVCGCSITLYNYGNEYVFDFYFGQVYFNLLNTLCCKINQEDQQERLKYYFNTFYVKTIETKEI